MSAADPGAWWTTLTATERASVAEVYFADRSLADAAERLRTGVEDVRRAVQSAYRRVAAAVLAGDDPAGRPQVTSAGTRSGPG